MMKIPKLFMNLYLISGLLFTKLQYMLHPLAFSYYLFLKIFLSRAFVPAVLLGEVEPKSNEQHVKGRELSGVRL
jgi:hypothetical protein